MALALLMSGNPPLGESDLILVETPEDVAEFARWLGERRPVLGLDTETGGLEWRDRLRTVQLGDARTGFVIDFERWGGLAQWALSAYNRPMVLHNAAFDIHHLERNGCKVRRELLDDTLIMAHLLDPPAPHGLKPMSKKLIDKNADVGQLALDEGMRRQKWTWDTVPIDFEPYWMYSALDPVETARLWEILKPQTDQQFSSLYDLELAALWPLVDAERLGMAVDEEYGRDYSASLLERSTALYARAQEDFGVKPGSYAVAERLLADGIELVKLTDAGRWSLDKEVLEGLADNDRHPLARIVLDYKRAVKFRGTYCEAVLSRLDANGIVHPRINPLGARTGRMSISTPPLQQIPSGDRGTRRMFVPRDGRSLVSIDFSNIEIRLWAHFSGDPTMSEAFHKGEDVHMAMARRMYGPNAGKKERKKAKSGTLGKPYGIGAEKFAVQQGVAMSEAQAFLADYDRTFPDAVEFLQYVAQVGAERFKSENLAYVTTPAGRRATLTRGEAYARQFYKLVNYELQGYAADMLKDGLVRLCSAGMTQDRFILPVHDELVFDVPVDEAEDFGREAAAILEGTGDGLTVPITCDVEIYAESWAESVSDD